MVNGRPSDAAELAIPVAPVVKRKRRASCLGEHERRERKRAIDREAQRSLREKTKTHIAELERTIQILRDQDRNVATANLLSEIDNLRAENERLRDVIDCVKSVVGNEVAPRTSTATEHPPPNGGVIASPASSSNEHRSPKPCTVSFVDDIKPSLPTPTDLPSSYDFSEQSGSAKLVDLDGMSITGVHTSSARNLDIDLEPVEEISTETITEMQRDRQVDIKDWENNPVAAYWGPLMLEFFGDNWHCPSPTIIHIGTPDSLTPMTSITVCPIWKQVNELFEKIYSSCIPARTQYATLYGKPLSAPAEAGLLYLGIKEGWTSISDEWMQSPALVVLKQVDEFLFCHLPKVKRLASAYKSFKLLKYYLNRNEDQLSTVPTWLRPSVMQSSNTHPIAIDFFAWPTLRDRFVSQHSSIFQTSALSHVYGRYLKFDWPFAFEDAFFHDEATGYHYPSPLFERYHGDLRYWSVANEFYEKFPEMRADIEGDRRRFAEDVGV
ncbi:uncharacterized protein M421DRAFT_88290 [Didymella exigua CBS 183.55]|uniref:BZIP domain-containing protein n=1 Tax=Didymella exigua CBS 183.55 TaxID=1150837 RepID=A0A6A5S2G8_9PLEO|nr:uncharacterized protein M421DRAFT_88290 [Didymella exigua CBS 183.55]KAF1934302.1 hypothetical protein M421DRAFT_88290 [Didymella exigua CBS 183.55]